MAARAEDGAALAPHDEADNRSEAPMQPVAQAEAVLDDKRAIGGLALEIEGFVFEDAVTDGLEGG